MSWLSKALAKLKKKKNNEKVGETTSECPLKETGLLVMVMRGSNGEPFEGATVDIAGQGTGASHSKKTDNLKVALFKPVEPDTYDIDATLPEEFADDYEAPETEQKSVPSGSCPIHIVRTVPFVDLKVNVFSSVVRSKNDENLDGVQVKLERTDGPPDVFTGNSAAGWAEFKKIKIGKYKISVQDLGKYKQTHYSASTVDCTTRDLGGKPNVAKIPVVPFSILKVRVLRDYDKKNMENIRVRLEEKNQEKTTVAKTGIAEFTGLMPETYTVKLLLSPEEKKTYATPEPLKVSLKQGEEKKVDIELSMHRLKIVLVDNKAKPLSGKEWKLLSPVEKNGTTGGNGLIEIEGLSRSASSGKLEVKLKKTSVKKKADEAAGKEDLKKYPPVVVAKEFKDPEPPSKLFENEKFEWDLTIGLQETLDAKGRLHNLGYLCEGEAQKTAVKTYQKTHMNQPKGSGNLSDIESHLTNLHDKP